MGLFWEVTSGSIVFEEIAQSNYRLSYAICFEPEAERSESGAIIKMWGQRSQNVRENIMFS